MKSHKNKTHHSRLDQQGDTHKTPTEAAGVMLYYANSRRSRRISFSLQTRDTWPSMLPS